MPLILERTLRVLGVYKAYEEYLWRQIRNSQMPGHIGVILDGNRRWARENLLPVWIGHRRGAEKVQTLLDWCLDLNVKTITIYVFSMENFQRPPEEITTIMKLAEEKIRTLLANVKIHQKKIRVKAIGRIHLLPQVLQDLIAETEKSTENYAEHFLNIAIAYGGRAEIVDATRWITKAVTEGRLRPEDIDEKLIEDHLYTSHLPKSDPDLIIRTSGEERLSGFLLWQSAYSELYFLDVYWPDLRKIDLWRAVRIYQKRKRRFGH
jgi:tritrans,polycis-undecaprenyl-diphosphate synthase [geranylgeranyl-diphosphate specific]